MTTPADVSMIVDARNTALLLLVATSVSLCPDAHEILSRKVVARWRQFKGSIRSALADNRPENGSFWEIDMTKFEP